MYIMCVMSLQRLEPWAGLALYKFPLLLLWAKCFLDTFSSFVLLTEQKVKTNKYLPQAVRPNARSDSGRQT